MAEGVPLLRVYLGNWIEGSNPSFSAIYSGIKRMQGMHLEYSPAAHHLVLGDE